VVRRGLNSLSPDQAVTGNGDRLIVVLAGVRAGACQCTDPAVTVKAAGLPLLTAPDWFTPPSGVTSS
jgi:hypothetical protein